MNSHQSNIEDPPDHPDPPPDQPAANSHPPLGFGMFLGQDGLRPVWGILLYLFLWYTLRYFIFPLCEMLFRSSSFNTHSIAPHDEYAYESAAFLCAALPTWLMAKLECRSLSNYGFGRKRRARNLSSGLFWGLALLSLLLLILRLTNFLRFDTRLLFGPSVWWFGVVWLGGFLLVALAEETFLRGYLQFTMSRGLEQLYRLAFAPARASFLGFWTAATVLSFVFGFSHVANAGESPLGLLSAGLIGLIFCLSLWRTGSLWWAIGFHAAWDWAQSFLFGVPDSGLMVKGHLLVTHATGPAYLSGGLTGPEGSALLIPVLVVAVAVVMFTLPKTRNRMTADNAPTDTALDFS